VGATAPAISSPHNQESSGPIRKSPEKSETQTGNSKKFPAQPHKIFRKNPVRDPAIFKQIDPTHPTLKKIGRLLPLTSRSAKKPVGQINFKTGRGDLFCSSTLT
jgi:hypothetical protein